MYRDNRKTDFWIKGRDSIGPGVYSNSPSQDKKITHNKGKVPFGVCDERFKTEFVKLIALPGKS